MTNSVLRVLCVDDDRDWLELFAEVLRGAGYAVLSAASGAQALSLLDDFKPDVIVTDLAMPLMDGQHLVAALQARRCSTPIVVVTGETRVMGAPQLEAAFDVIEKPASLDRLLSVVGAAATRSSSP